MTPDYSASLICARRLLQEAEEQAARHNFGMALAFCRQAKNEVEAMAVSLLLLGHAEHAEKPRQA